MIRQKIKNSIPSCCNIDFLNIHSCSHDEILLVSDILPSVKTIIVLAHHIKNSLEWTWFPFESERCNTTCGADLHAKSVLERIEFILNNNGHLTCMIDYPGKCGIRMKDFANKTGLGQIGDNYMFLHSHWGAWTHLRLLLTNAEISDTPAKKTNVCTHCGKCRVACPANAIKNDSFDGVACGQYQDSMMKNNKDAFHWKCEICVRVCPIGQSPVPIKILK